MPGLEFWAGYFRTIFVPQIEAFAESLSRRVLPSFDNIEAEGRRIEQEAYRQLSRWSPHDDEPEPDFAAAAEQAREQAITYWVMMYEVVQGVINLFAVGLWHLFEQQAARFARNGLPYVFDPPNHPFRDVQGALLHMGLDITLLTSYPKVDELRLLANCAKHGDGSACAQLRTRRPDLFTPWRHGDQFGPPGALPVIAPLGGEDLYLTPEGFQEYAAAVIAFWEELAAKVAVDPIAALRRALHGRWHPE